MARMLSSLVLLGESCVFLAIRYDIFGMLRVVQGLESQDDECGVFSCSYSHVKPLSRVSRDEIFRSVLTRDHFQHLLKRSYSSLRNVRGVYGRTHIMKTQILIGITNFIMLIHNSEESVLKPAFSSPKKEPMSFWLIFLAQPSRRHPQNLSN